MSDLIDRQAAIDAVHEEFDECLVWDESGRRTADEVEQILDKLPAVQPQPEIIRCKDCKHWGKRGLCEIWDYYISNEDFYCGCAKRRTE